MAKSADPQTLPLYERERTMIDRFEKFSFAISELYRYLHTIMRDEMHTYGLKGPYATYFFALYRYKEGITAAELSDICFKNKADVSRAMTAFEHAKLIVREGGGPKSYRAPIRLTEKGRMIAEHLRERAQLAVSIAGKGLTDENRAVFYDSLEIIASNMRDICRDKLPGANDIDPES